ncbi:MAG: hypothetical protein EON98_07735 [Chitinophagaceae bacterium]|nr:MAG: hypothetical protein EON98_07735 [Chitinophagaceae bacterium]
MKTKTYFHTSHFPVPLVNNVQTVKERIERKVVQKSDLKNHRFAVIDNKSIEDPMNWDSSWFTNYE